MKTGIRQNARFRCPLRTPQGWPASNFSVDLGISVNVRSRRNRCASGPEACGWRRRGEAPGRCNPREKRDEQRLCFCEKNVRTPRMAKNPLPVSQAVAASAHKLGAAPGSPGSPGSPGIPGKPGKWSNGSPAGGADLLRQQQIVGVAVMAKTARASATSKVLSSPRPPRFYAALRSCSPAGERLGRLPLPGGLPGASAVKLLAWPKSASSPGSPWTRRRTA